jgi:hypothetical protein
MKLLGSESRKGMLMMGLLNALGEGNVERQSWMIGGDLGFQGRVDGVSTHEHDMNVTSGIHLGNDTMYCPV